MQNENRNLYYVVRNDKIFSSRENGDEKEKEEQTRREEDHILRTEKM